MMLLRGFRSQIARAPVFRSQFLQSTQKEIHDKNRLRFIFLSASVGGAILGFSVRAYFDETRPSAQPEKAPAVVSAPQPQSQNNLMNFSASWNSNWDGLAPKEGEPLKKGTRYITLVRHGQYVTDATKHEKKLTELGQEQADLCGKRLKGISKKYDNIYVSELVRSLESGQIIHKYFPQAQFLQDGLLSEGYPAPVSPSQENNPINLKWNRPKHGPRIAQAFEKYIKRADSDEDVHELFVIHGNVIRYFLCRVLQFPVEGWLRVAIYNTGITQIEIRPSGNVSVKAVGDVGHLEKQQITYH